MLPWGGGFIDDAFHTVPRPSRGLHGLLIDHVAVVDLQQGEYNKNWDESGKCTIFIKFSILRHTMQGLVSKIRE